MKSQLFFQNINTKPLSNENIEVFKLARESDTREVSELRERIVRLEVKVEDHTKRIDSLSNYTKELYEYLQKVRK